MRLVIIFNGTLGKDGEFREGLDFSQCGLPANFWALQWNEWGNNQGHIEYNSQSLQNTPITEIPAWANSCLAVYQAKLDQEAAEAAAAEAAAEAARLAAQQSAQGA